MRTKKIHFINLSSEAIKSLKKIASFKTYSTNAPLHYQGQTPIVAYLIIKGNILLLKNNKIYHKLTKGCLIGYQELFLNAPSMFTAKILGDTEICYIDKSTILEISNSKSRKMSLLYSELTDIIL
jgi:CRP-like cAMP-binding protein